MDASKSSSHRAADAGSSATPRQRLDRPHATGGQPPHGPNENAEHAVDLARAPAGAGKVTGETVQMRLRQASELAEHLKNRNRQLNRRESHLNARVAQLEADDRNSQIDWDAKVAAIQERSAILDERESELERVARAIAAAEQALARREQAIETGLAEDREELERREKRLAQQEEELRSRQSGWESTARRQQSEIRERMRTIQQQQAAIQSDRNELARQIRLARENGQQVNALKLRYQELTTKTERRIEKQLAERKTQLDRVHQRQLERDDQLERREIAIRKLQSELNQAAIEIMEQRICIEQELIRIGEIVDPTEAMGNINRARADLRAQYAKFREHLQGLSDQMDRRTESAIQWEDRLRHRQIELAGWFRHQWEKLRAEAARINQDRQDLSYDRLAAS